MGSYELSSVIGDIKRAIQHSVMGSGLNVKKIDLEIKNVLEKSANGKLEFKPLNVNISGEVKEEDIQTICISLKPDIDEVTLMGYKDIPSQLAEAVALIKKAIHEAALKEPKFKLENAVITLQFQITKEGEISMILGAGGSSAYSHKIVLTLESV
ncbi:MAG: hypothetical protein GXY48_05455 [Methanomicrobiales archaeon]|nr:hypothetical protein [Methanomicrobiales archaeon]